MGREEKVMAELWDLFNKRTWLDSIKMKSSLKGYKPSEIHCIDFIGKNADSNVTKLADSFYMTRSAISKLTRKLMERGLIESYQKHGNRKEIYFRLTGKGNAAYQVHEELHKEYRKRDEAVFQQVTEEEYSAVLSFVGRYKAHLEREINKLSPDGKPQGPDKL